jgi:hypothetical protein
MFQTNPRVHKSTEPKTTQVNFRMAVEFLERALRRPEKEQAFNSAL